MKKTLTLAFSPCPNDTFIFDAMVHGKIDTHGLDFEYRLGDVEELNRVAGRGLSDVTKISFNAFFSVTDRYALLDSGAALGSNNGPLLISKKQFTEKDIPYLKIAIPGMHTTANLLLSVAYPKATDKVEYLFSDIENAVLNGEADAGLIIHESRFTYAAKGLHKIVDLGEYWEKETDSPVPLGGIAIKRELPSEIQQLTGNILKESVQYAFNHPDEATGFVKMFAQEMDKDVMYKHIALYVNDFTLSLGAKGRKAINTLYQKALRLELVKPVNSGFFID